MTPDIVNSGFVFTDGCGLMSFKFAKRISHCRSLMLSGIRYVPSVVLLRYR